MGRYQVPAFPLPVNVWRNPGGVPVGAPTLTTVGNLGVGSKVIQTDFDWPSIIDPSAPTMLRYMLFPAGVDIRGGLQVSLDWVEVPAGSGRFFQVNDVEQIAYGFQNWHQIAFLLPYSPMPPSPVFPPVPPAAVLIQRNIGPSVLGDVQALPACTGGVFLLLAQANATGGFPTLSTANNGPVASVRSAGAGTQAGIHGGLSMYVFPETGAADTVTIICPSPGPLMWFAVAVGQNTADQGGNAAASGSPVTLGPTGLTTAAIEVLMCACMAGGTAFNPTWVPPVVPVPSSVMSAADVNGNTWNLFGGFSMLSAIQAVFAQCGYTITGSGKSCIVGNTMK